MGKYGHTVIVELEAFGAGPQQMGACAVCALDMLISLITLSLFNAQCSRLVDCVLPTPVPNGTTRTNL